MAFWIFIGIIALVVVICGIAGTVDYYSRSEWFSSGAVISVVVAVIGLFVIAIGSSTSPTTDWKVSHHYSLRALVTKTSAESHADAVFFLGFGGGSSSSGDVTNVSYIRVAGDGGTTLHKASLKTVVIYEDVPAGGQPWLDDMHKVRVNDGAFWPWPFTQEMYETQHRFHIPKGTILEQYEVTP